MGKTNTNWKTVNIFKESAKAIKCREHFRLKKYEVTITKIAKVRYGTHCKYNINLSLDSKDKDINACQALQEPH